MSDKKLLARLNELNSILVVGAKKRLSPDERRRLRRKKRLDEKKRDREWRERQDADEKRARIKLLKAYEILENLRKKINGMYIVLKHNNNEDNKAIWPVDFEETWDDFWIALEIIGEHEPSKHRKARVFGMFKPLLEEAVKAGQIPAKVADYYIKYQDSIERKKKLNLPSNLDMDLDEVIEEEPYLEDTFERN